MQFNSRLGVAAALLVAGVTTPGLSQAPPTVSLGFGVDTTHADVGAIVETLRAYYKLRGAGHARSAQWNAQEQKDRHDYDLTADFVFQGLGATIVTVSPVGGNDREYIVRTLFAHTDSAGKTIRPIALQRLYATRRTDGGWELGSALPRLTAGWVTRDVKFITYHMPPGWPFDETKAQRATRFVDSAAHALQVPRPPRLDYYLTPSAEETYRIIGLDYFVQPSGPAGARGGKSFPNDGMVISGDPALGEAYLHELAHAVIGVEFPEGTRNSLLNEGFATWLGGSRDRSYRQMVELLLAYQEANPKVGFFDLIGGGPGLVWGPDDTDALYATGALIFDVVNAHNGVWGIKKLLGVRGRPNRAVEPELREMLKFFGSMDTWWRTETQRAVARSRSSSRTPR